MPSRTENAKAFIDTYIADAFGWIEDEPWSNDSCFRFDNPQRYYAIVDAERHGCWGIHGAFYSKADLNALVRLQLQGPSRDHWDNVWISDTDDHKVITPELKLEDSDVIPRTA